jgi:heme exporter protein B
MRNSSKILLSVWRREWQVARQSGVASFYPLCFFLLVVLLFPLSLDLSAVALGRMAVGIIWVAALLATFLCVEALFEQDYQSGCLDQFYFSGMPLSVLVMVKLAAAWIFTLGPMILLAPWVALAYGLNGSQAFFLCLSLLCGTPVLLVIGALASALTLGLRQQGLLLALLCLPLYIPVLVFGAGGVSETPLLYIMLSLLLVTLSVGPFALSLALRIGVE